MIEYQLIRSDRRTLSIGINGEGALVVRAPKRMPIQEIEAFLQQKQTWILQKQALAQRSARKREEAALCEGAQIPFWGGCLTVRFGALGTAVEEGAVLWLPQRANALQQALKWRRKRAEELLSPRVAAWAQRTGLKPVKVSYGNARSRWGSMSSQGSLRLNTALVHLPPHMADYVIVHELAHLQHPDHSPAFHALVRRFLPDSDELRRQIKAFSYVTCLWQEK